MSRLIRYGIAIFFFLTGMSTSMSQSLQPIPYENSGWTYVGWYIDTNTMLPDQEDVYQCYFDGDTVLNSTLYHKFYFDGMHYSDYQPYSIGDHVYIGGMRNEGELYYFLAKDSTSDVLIYDLSKSNIGDTLPLGYYNHLSHIVIEDTAFQIMEDGSHRKVLYLEHDWTPPYPSRLYEGMGFITGLIPNELFSLYHCDGGYNLQSFCHNGTLIYLTGGAILIFPDECGFTVSVDQYLVLTQNISAYPNPFNTSTTIEYELKEVHSIQLTVYSSIGNVVYQIEEQKMAQGKHSITLSLHHLPAGLYYAVLRSEEGVSVFKLIKQ